MERKTFVQLCTVISIWVLFFSTGIGPDSARAWFWDDPVVLTIDGEQFTSNDYRQWWELWREKGMSSPTSPDDFINWQLMVKEGRQMDLQSAPGYQRKVATFIKVRSLMMFKAEEIDDKIVISEDDIRAVYRQKYIPRLQVRIFYFPTMELAQQQEENFKDGSLTLAYLEKLPPADGGPSLIEKKILRQPQLTAQWLAALEADGGNLALRGPVTMGKGAILFEVISKDDGGADDFAKTKVGIKERLRKDQERLLTQELVAQLRKKFDLQIDEQVLAQINDTALTPEQREQPLVTSSKGIISAADFQAMLAREKKFRRAYKFKEEELGTMKLRVLNNMIAQTLISWAATARHYEQRSPLQDIVAFYRNHRLVREVENRVLKPLSAPSDQELQEYYRVHQDQYSYPETVGVAMVEGGQDLINMIWQEVRKGRDFFEVAKRHFPQGVIMRQQPMNHFSSEIRVVLGDLGVGEVSSPFSKGQNYALVKLVNRRQKTPIPFVQVKDEMRQQLLQERAQQARAHFLNQLKEQAQIVLDQQNWQKMVSELAPPNE